MEKGRVGSIWYAGLARNRGKMAGLMEEEGPGVSEGRKMGTPSSAPFQRPLDRTPDLHRLGTLSFLRAGQEEALAKER